MILPTTRRAIGLRSGTAFGQAGEQRWEIVLAGSVITTVPLLIVFFVAQRHFLAGITTEGSTATR